MGKPKSEAAKPARERRALKFTQAGALLGARIRGAGAKRGFAESKLLTQWAEICGPDLAALARPLKVSYGREGMGATLLLACAGPNAPELQMQAETIRQRVNACYGYNAISRVRIAQEDAAGFAEAQARFAPPPGPPPVAPAARKAAGEEVRGVNDDGLRAALQRLGENILSRRRGGI